MAKQSLGRGLGALIQEANEQDTPEQAAINEIDIDFIEANPWQPRTDFDEERLEELSASIKTLGIIQPLTLRKINEHRYQIIAGERRFRASKMAGLTEIPAIVLEKDDRVAAQISLIENIQREDLNPIEEAAGYVKLSEEFGLNQEEIAKRVGIGAVIFNDLSAARIKDEIFDWDTLLNFQGETGPYMQYIYVRTKSLMEKANYVPDVNKVNFDLLKENEAIDIIKSNP